MSKNKIFKNFIKAFAVLMLFCTNSEIIAQDAGNVPKGIEITVIAMSVIIITLVLISIIFKQIGLKLIALHRRRYIRFRFKKLQPVSEEEVSFQIEEFSGDVYAAITAAVYLYTEELHDVENAVLTINKVSRTYSPWSSKIHGLNTYYKR